MPEYTLVASTTIQQAVTVQSGTGSMSRMKQTMVEAVFILPDQAAAMTLPPSTATRRRPVTASSRAMTIMAAQAGKRPVSTYTNMTEMTSSLSARGSRNLPKFVTWLQCRAM